MRVTFTVLTMLLLVPQSFAQPDLESRLREFLQRFPDSDLNGDGKLTREEVRQFKTNRRPQQKEADRQDSRTRNRRPPTVADFAYGDHRLQRFDLWTVPDAKGPTPLVIYIHGGGFRGGDKRAVDPGRIQQYLDKGIAFASMNYRLSHVGPYPIMMNDCARGLQTIRHQAKQWNIDADRIGCFGGSAGAGISLWLAFHDDLAAPDSKDPIAQQSTRIKVAATINGQSTYDLRTFREWFGVPDLPPHGAMIPLFGIQRDEDWMSPRITALMEDASPITRLSPDDNVAVYMVYNRGDVPVTKETNPSIWVHHCRLGYKLKEAMDALGKECYVIIKEKPQRNLKYPDMVDFFSDKLSPQ